MLQLSLTSHAHVPQFPLAVCADHVVLGRDLGIGHGRAESRFRLRIAAPEQRLGPHSEGPVTRLEAAAAALVAHVDEARVQVEVGQHVAEVVERRHVGDCRGPAEQRVTRPVAAAVTRLLGHAVTVETVASGLPTFGAVRCRRETRS